MVTPPLGHASRDPQSIGSDTNCSGVMYTLDPDGGFPGVVVINVCRRSGELLERWQGERTEYVVFKPMLDRTGVSPIIARGGGTAPRGVAHARCVAARAVESTADGSTIQLSDAEVLELARRARTVEEHYGRPMEIDWERDRSTGELYLLQARPWSARPRESESWRRSATLKPPATAAHGAARRAGTSLRLMHNISSPSSALRHWRVPSSGVALARLELIIRHVIGVHPLALLNRDTLKDDTARALIDEVTREYADRSEFFVDQLAQGIARIAASQHPRPVVVRTSSFTSSEHAELAGGREFEPIEQNPALGLRGAARYCSAKYRPAFDLECRAIRRVRDEMGLENVMVMIPFCRTPTEADRVIEILASNGLVRGRNGLQIHLSCDVASNILLADLFAERFDGFSLDVARLARLCVGLESDHEGPTEMIEESDEAVRRALRRVVKGSRRTGTDVVVSLPSLGDRPGLATFLVESGIDGISVDPENFEEACELVAAAEEDVRRDFSLHGESMHVADCAEGLVGVLFIDELHPPIGGKRILDSVAATRQQSGRN